MLDFDLALMKKGRSFFYFKKYKNILFFFEKPIDNFKKRCIIYHVAVNALAGVAELADAHV